MTTFNEIETLQSWLDRARAREGLIGFTEQAETGEEFTTCGDLELDSRAARILLETVQSRIPGWVGRDGNGNTIRGRERTPIQPRPVQRLPAHLFTINWADSGPGCSWPEAYHVTFVPELDVRIVTASQDTSEIWGCTDLAIGWCRPVRSPDFGTRKIVMEWWERGCGDGTPWGSFWSPGFVTQERAEGWRKRFYGSMREYE